MKTVILSAALTVFPYYFVYYLSWSRSKAEILAKQDPEYTSDGMKQYIREYKRRRTAGLVEDMQPIISASENGDNSGSGSDWDKSKVPYIP